MVKNSLRETAPLRWIAFDTGAKSTRNVSPRIPSCKTASASRPASPRSPGIVEEARNSIPSPPRPRKEFLHGSNSDPATPEFQSRGDATRRARGRRFSACSGAFFAGISRCRRSLRRRSAARYNRLTVLSRLMDSAFARYYRTLGQFYEPRLVHGSLGRARAYQRAGPLIVCSPIMVAGDYVDHVSSALGSFPASA